VSLGTEASGQWALLRLFQLVELKRWNVYRREIFNLWLDVFGEIKEAQVKKEEEVAWRYFIVHWQTTYH